MIGYNSMRFRIHTLMDFCDKLTSRLPGSHLILFGCFSYERWTSNNRRSPSTLLRLKRVTWWHASKKASQNERSMNWSNIWMKDYIRSEEFWHWHWHSPSLMAFVFFFVMLTWWVMNPLFTDRLLTCFLRELSSSTTCMFWSNPGFQKTMNNAWDRYCKTSMLENNTFPPFRLIATPGRLIKIAVEHLQVLIRNHGDVPEPRWTERPPPLESHFLARYFVVWNSWWSY